MGLLQKRALLGDSSLVRIPCSLPFVYDVPGRFKIQFPCFEPLDGRLDMFRGVNTVGTWTPKRRPVGLGGDLDHYSEDC